MVKILVVELCAADSCGQEFWCNEKCGYGIIVVVVSEISWYECRQWLTISSWVMPEMCDPDSCGLVVFVWVTYRW